MQRDGESARRMCSTSASGRSVVKLKSLSKRTLLAMLALMSASVCWAGTGGAVCCVVMLRQSCNLQDRGSRCTVRSMPQSGAQRQGLSFRKQIQFRQAVESQSAPLSAFVRSS